MNQLTIRAADSADAAAISALIHELMPYMTLDPKGAGAEQFMASMAQPAVARYLGAPNYRYRLALVDGQLAGLVAVRDNGHLFHLFVADAFSRRGIARRLWQEARAAAIEAGNSTGFTVNASIYALPMYLGFGFAPTAARVEEHGIAYVPMCLPAGHQTQPH